MDNGSPGKSRNAVTDAMNGDIEHVDPPARRALFALATEQDEHAALVSSQHEDQDAEFDKRISALESRINYYQRLVISTAFTFVATLVATVYQRLTGG